MQPYDANTNTAIDVVTLVDTIQNTMNFDTRKEATDYLFSRVAAQVDSYQPQLNISHLNYLFNEFGINDVVKFWFKNVDTIIIKNDLGLDFRNNNLEYLEIDFIVIITFIEVIIAFLMFFIWSPPIISLNPN